MNVQRLLILLSAVCLMHGHAVAATFVSEFEKTHDRVWAGPAYWANPMEDWRIHDGHLECLSSDPLRNIHLLTHRLGDQSGAFTVSVELKGAGAIRIGASAEIKDYRADALRGAGLDCGLDNKGRLFIGSQFDARKSSEVAHPSQAYVLTLKGDPATTGTYELTLSLTEVETGRSVATVTKSTVNPELLSGSIALVNGDCSIFNKWSVDGAKVEEHEDRAFGPILWAMHTLSDSRSKSGYVMKMTAQLPPLSKKDGQTVILQTSTEGQAWEPIASAKIEPAACTATFRIENWNASQDTPYRLAYTTTPRTGAATTHYYSGTVRRDPTDRPLSIAGFTGNKDYVFPNCEIARNVAIQDPDVLFFSGDQIYEDVGGFNIVRAPVERSIHNYLRKWYLLGWAFGDLMRDRPTITLPDDHDVYQGNIWGQGGRDCGGIKGHAEGGYAQDPKMVNVVHRTQTSHHPDPFDARPIERGISAYYGDMVYGRVSFAILADRMFKSGPKGKVDTGGSRPDWVRDPEVSVEALNKPGLVLLGERQLKFLDAWAQDWREADMKIVLSQTIFCNLANYHGGGQTFLVADLDSNGWPQAGRDRALRAMRRGFAFHYAGDQHLPSMIWYGIDEHKDAGWAFCVPSIAAGYPRSWRPDKEGKPVLHRPEPGLANTGDYLDGLRNKVSVYGVGNPAASNRKGRVNTAHDKSSGHAIVRMNQKARTITMECWRLQFDAANPKPGDQFPGWPRTIDMYDNYGRRAAAMLPILSITGATDPVVQVVNDATGEIEYTVRIKGDTFQPKVFTETPHTITIRDEQTGVVSVLKNIAPLSKGETKTLSIDF